MTLTEWMLTPRGSLWTCESIAQAIGASRLSVHAWRSSAYRPSDEFKLRIAALTRGKVAPNDWFPELRRPGPWPDTKPATKRLRRPRRPRLPTPPAERIAA